MRSRDCPAAVIRNDSRHRHWAQHAWEATARFGSANPFAFLDLQDVQELANFFERRVSACQVSLTGTVAFTEDF